MSHFGNTQIQRTTPPEWLGVGAQIGKLVNDWAQRSDLVAYVGERAGVESGAPALYNPASAEVEVNTSIAFGFVTPEQVGDLNQRNQQFEFPKASGAILHEALHARFSTWDMPKAIEALTPEEYGALHLLEESRIESLGVRTYPQNRSFLRACAMDIVLADMSEETIKSMTQVRQVAHLLALTYARVTAGVLENDDVEPVRVLVDENLSGATLDKLRTIWTNFQRLDARSDVERMYELAREWVQAVKEESEAQGEPQPGESGESGEAGESGAGEAFAEMIREAIEEALGNAEIGSAQEVQDQQTQEEYKEQAQSKQDKGAENRTHKVTAEKVFGSGTSPSNSGSNSTLTESRMPTSEERVSAVKIAKALERAKYRDRVRVESGSVLPPGRVRSRVVVQGEAMRARGVTTPVEAFRRVQRKHTDDPNLTIGVMVDISGSMSSAMQAMASSAWILSEASRRVQGKTAMVYYGSGVFPTLKAGQHLDKVNIYSAPDSTEKFDKAFQALNGSLGLLDGSGARLLVVVSDGHYTHDEQAKAHEWIRRCATSGVAVLWIGAGSYGSMGEDYTNGMASASYVRLGENATDASDAIGRMAEVALTSAGSRR
jgi:hypothetical protein